MDPQMMVELGALALVGGAALIAGIAEDLESDVGSQSNPNSQVQLAPQMGTCTGCTTKQYLENRRLIPSMQQWEPPQRCRS